MVLIYANSKQDIGQPCVVNIVSLNGKWLYTSDVRKYSLRLTRKYRGHQSIEEKEIRARM